MDKFVTKTKRERKEPDCISKRRKQLVQSSITSLKGVVVVEDVLRCKAALKLPGQSADNILTALDELAQKIPPRNVLKSTKIGHVINRLTRHEDERVRTLAAQLVKAWKRHYEAKLDRPMIEVTCDRKTESLRQAGRKLLAKELRLSESHVLAESIEREVYHRHGQRTSPQYRKRLRSLVFTLKHQNDVRQQVLDCVIDVTKFVDMYSKAEKT